MAAPYYPSKLENAFVLPNQSMKSDRAKPGCLCASRLATYTRQAELESTALTVETGQSTKRKTACVLIRYGRLAIGTLKPPIIHQGPIP